MEHYNEYIFQYQVLIDTWWNVNDLYDQMLQKSYLF